MCGRYAASRNADDLLMHFEVQDPPEQVLPPSWNVAPTDRVHLVAVRDGRRVLQVARWGLVPSWAKNVTVGARFINARAETVADKPAFRAAYARRRCLLPADGYYEWKRDGAAKAPWFLSDRTGDPLAMAGLYELWRAPDGPWVRSCTIVTTSAPDELGEIHERTPLLVPREAWTPWLDPELAHPGDLLVPGVPGVLDAWPVGPAVGNVRTQGPQLCEPVPSPGPGSPGG